MEDKSSRAFMEGTIAKTVFKNAIPSICAMLMVLVYNLADFFFIGQTHNDYMVAAVSLATPLFLVYMALGSLFGIGGTSVISRALGEGKSDYIKKVSSFCTWGCIGIGFISTILMWLFMDKLVNMLGASSETFDYTKSYLNIIVGAGTFVMLTNCFSNTIRSEGEPNIAMRGTIIGNIINIILDPIFIFTFGLGIKGAALATVIGNVVGALYYFSYFFSGKSILSISIKDFSIQKIIVSSVFAIGLPAAIVDVLMSFANMFVNIQISFYGDMPIAAYGVAAKILMIVATVAIGLGQGVLPILGYCWGAKEYKRFFDCIKFSALFAITLCVLISILVFVFTKPIVAIFLTDQTALEQGIVFTRIMFSIGWTVGMMCVFMTTLQAIGAAKTSLIVSMSRQGLLFIPLVFIMGKIWGLYGIVWAQPTSDVITVVLAFILMMKGIKSKQTNSAQNFQTACDKFSN